MEPKAGGHIFLPLGAPAPTYPFHQVGAIRSRRMHAHPGAHPSSCHMFMTRISQQLPPPRSLPLTLEGRGGRASRVQTFRKKPQVLRRPLPAAASS